MRVLIVNGIYGTRSTGRSLKELADKLRRENNEVFIASPQKSCDEKNFYRIGNFLDHKLHAILCRLTGKQAYYSKTATRKLIKYVKKISPDVIHLEVIHGNFINFNMFMKFLAESKMPTVFVLDDCWYYTGKCFHYTEIGCDRWQDACGNCPKKRDPMMPSYFFDATRKCLADKKKAFSSLDNYAVIAVSKWLLSEAKKSILKDARILKCIYNSIDLDVFRPKKSEKREELGLNDKFVILGVAMGFNETKGLRLFLELAEKTPENYRIVLVGKVTENVTLPENIISVGVTENTEELCEYYSFADAFVQMSTEETFGKVTAEALASGTPAVVFDSTANPELIGENCGYVVKPKDVDAVLEKLKIIEKNGKEFYSSSCREFIKSNMDKDKNLVEFIKVYEELLNR